MDMHRFLAVIDTVTGTGLSDPCSIPHSTNTIGKDMNPIILLPAIGK